MRGLVGMLKTVVGVFDLSGILRQPVFGHCSDEPGGTRRSRYRIIVVEADHPYFLMSQLNQELHGIIGSLLIIHLNGRNLIFIRVGGNQYKWNPAIYQLLIILRVQDIAGEHNPVHLLLVKRINVRQHPLLVAVGIADHEAIAELNTGILHPPDHPGKIQILNIRDQ
ncbi:hypothetical protein D3C73_1121950 [compost metagenome]